MIKYKGKWITEEEHEQIKAKGRERELTRRRANGIKEQKYVLPRDLTPEQRKEAISRYKVEWAKEKRHRLRLELFERYGGKCVCCGVSDYRWLSLDHINQDGGEERKTINKYNGNHINAANRINFLHKQPKRDDLQLLCYNCHFAKDYFGCCPHNDVNSNCYIQRS
jgi:hypothetical protein